MLPWAMRRRSASGVMSASSIWSAARTTWSGPVSRWRTPVMRSITSLSDSRCWMLRVEITWIPASSRAWMSCQRLACREPGTLVCASSSTRGHLGAAGQHDVEVHLLQPGAPVLEGPPRHDLQVADLLGRARPAVGFDEPDDHVGPTLRPAPALVQHVVRLADARRRPEVDAQRAAAHRHHGARSGGRNRFCPRWLSMWQVSAGRT